MSQLAVLLDLENNRPTARLLRSIVEHYSTIYLFNCRGTFEYALEDLTELAAWIGSGQVMVLDTPETDQKEFEYAVVVGQLIALLEDDAHIEVISAMDSSDMLLGMLQESDISCNLIQIQREEELSSHLQHKIPSKDTILQQPHLLLVKKYCDALAKQNGKPNTLDKLKNSIANTLKVDSQHTQHLVGVLMSLKLVKSYGEHISFRKKVFQQWIELNLTANPQVSVPVQDLSQAIEQIIPQHTAKVELVPTTATQAAQHELFKNFDKIDHLQLEVARKLRELKNQKPQDIYALRDLLEQMFPKADIRLLLKELIEKGFIYWNGHEVLYSHEMFFN